MTYLDAYRVEPDDTAPLESVPRDDSPIVLTKEQKRNVGGLGWWSIAVFLAFYFVIAFITSRVLIPEGSLSRTSDALVLVTVFVILAISATVWVARRVRRYKQRELARELLLKRAECYERAAQEREQEYKSEVRRKESEAEALTLRLRNLLKSSLKTKEAISDWLARVSRAVNKAEKEYAESAFDPYWTAIENAAAGLAAFDQGVRELSQAAQDYYKSLKGWRHNFPAFPVSAETLPDPVPAVEEFRRVVRLGQTNFQFANIWEHRKTQKVLFEGFRNLGDAVNNLGGTIERSFTSLESSINAGLALTSEEQARTRGVLAEEAGRTRATIDARADEQMRLAETQVRLLKDLKD